MRTAVRTGALCCALAALVAAVYLPVHAFSFVRYDDQAYVFENQHVARGLTWEGVAWGFSSVHAANWHPVTWLSHMLDVELYGLEPGGHHVSSVVLHALGTVLLFLALRSMTGDGRRSMLVAALFAIHPAHVESVAWVAERKDVLSGVLWFLGLAAYARYARTRSRGWYAAVLACFAVALLAKPMVVTFPLVLLLLDVWPLRRVTVQGWRAELPRAVVEKLPLLALSMASSVVTYLAQRGGRATFAGDGVGLALRVQNAVASYGWYLWKAFVPTSLAVFYPHPATIGARIPALVVAAAALLLVALSGAALWSLRARPALAVGWFWFLGTLVPVLGLVQVGGQAHADRYTYLPYVGLFVAVAWAIPDGIARGRAWLVAAGLAVAALAGLASRQVAVWRDDLSLFGHATRVVPEAYVAWNGLGVALEARGDRDAARAAYEQALRIKPNFYEAWNGLGVLEGRGGQPAAAAEMFQQAVRIKPDYAEAWNNLAAAYIDLGLPERATDAATKAISADPGYPEAWNQLGNARLNAGEHAAALDAFLEAARLRPGYAEAWASVAVVSTALRRPEAARAALERLRALDPAAAERLRARLGPRG